MHIRHRAVGLPAMGLAILALPTAALGLALLLVLPAAGQAADTNHHRGGCTAPEPTRTVDTYRRGRPGYGPQPSCLASSSTPSTAPSTSVTPAGTPGSTPPAYTTPAAPTGPQLPLTGRHVWVLTAIGLAAIAIGYRLLRWGLNRRG